MNVNNEAIRILLVEDNPSDIRLTEMAFKKGRIMNCLHFVRDGEQALDYLYRRGEYENAERPHLVLLDLNIPKISGQEVLKIVKEDANLREIPICVLTGSKAEEDIVKSYKLHANCYIVKPVDLSRLVEVAQTIEHFWFQIVALPHEAAEVFKTP
jgi:two-component system, chemotaxis family, response regulator Rcp1